jgi:hypothetical protein
VLLCHAHEYSSIFSQTLCRESRSRADQGSTGGAWQSMVCSGTPRVDLPRHDVGLQPRIRLRICKLRKWRSLAVLLHCQIFHISPYLKLTIRYHYHSQQHDVARYLTQFPRSSTSISCCTAHNRLWGSGIQI